ncbi:MAG: HD domain-containing protein [Lachnospiraceae bacterium]|nr:HD domain-containing protein [Lachnospiraceae bacterium]
MKISIPEDAKYITDKLLEAGFEAYVVGGCVRDSLLGDVPHDWDITTNARPLQVKEIFRRTVDTGLQHGTVTVMRGDVGYEVTTYRTDGDYSDGRHPDQVTFVPDLKEDLRRRDFTINAMAYNEQDGLIDLFGGVEDLKKGIIRCVGDPDDRFSEDALRMMRAIRFAARFGFEMTPDVRASITKLSGNLSKVSAERITSEFIALLTSDHPEMVRDMYETGLTAVFFPEFDLAMKTPQNHPHHCFNVGDHLIEAVRNSKNDRIVRLTMMLHDIGKPGTLRIDEEGITHFYGHAKLSAEMAEDILRRWKLDNETIRRVCRLVLYHDHGNDICTLSQARRAISVLEDDAELLLDVKKADVLAQSTYKREEKLALIESYRAAYEEIREKNQCCSMSDLAIGGADLKETGIKPGPEMGRILKALLEMVIEDPGINTREKLLELAADLEKE